jgi:hypothetical protein
VTDFRYSPGQLNDLYWVYVNEFVQFIQTPLYSVAQKRSLVRWVLFKEMITNNPFPFLWRYIWRWP